MQQYRISISHITGIIHMGTWVCAYSPTLYVAGWRVPEERGRCWWPTAFDLKNFKRGGHGGSRSTLNYVAAKDFKDNGTIVPLGTTVYHTGVARVYFTVPQKRQRLVGRGIARTNLSGPDARMWAVNVPELVGPSLAVRGPRGGMYVKPLHGRARIASRDPGLVLKDVIARGEPDGTMTVCEGVDGPVASDNIARLTNYPKRNQKRESIEWLIPAVGLSEGHRSGVNYHQVTDFEFSPDRRLLAVAAFEEFGTQHLDLHDFDGTKLTHKVRYDVPARLVSFSPDGLTLVMLGHDQDDDGTQYPDTFLTIMDLEA